MSDLALKIDVDTHQGLGHGVPRLLDCLARRGVAASFYVSMGPDNSGKAIRRFFTRKGFAGKMLKSNAVALYGLRTALYGTLLPAPEIARSFPDVLRRIVAEGHELGIHGNDHVYWHDFALTLSEPAVAREIDAAIGTFGEIVGGFPAGFAAPGWQCGQAALAVLDRRPFAYQSSTRGERPYRARIGQVEAHLPEIPTTLPTVDELLGQGIAGERLDGIYERSLGEESLAVLTVHAEVEGGPYATFFDRLLASLSGRVRFRRLVDIARELAIGRLPVCEVVQGTRPGRAGTVSCQRP
ncbi:MAG TPA: polysaccharide deacetylase family protein [Candidatus Binatia bacterium]|nr:polysaccharide deacetylase family protein [Candidatus Binatia bacterium]